MPLRILLFIGIISLFNACSFNKQLAEPAIEEKSHYQGLLEKLKQTQQVNYDELRMAYTETTHYNPVFGRDAELISNAFQLLDDEKSAAALNLIKQVLENNYVSLAAHYAAVLAYGLQGNEAQEDYHRNIVNGLMDAIEFSGNGKTPETAYVTISPNEAFTYLSLNAWEVVRKDRLAEADSIYYLYTVKTRNNETHYQLYFNVDILEQRSAARVSDYIKSQGYVPAQLPEP